MSISLKSTWQAPVATTTLAAEVGEAVTTASEVVETVLPGHVLPPLIAWAMFAVVANRARRSVAAARDRDADAPTGDRDVADR